MNLYEPQPASLIYAYDSGWKIIKYITENVFNRIIKEAEKWKKFGDSYEAKAKYESDVFLQCCYRAAAIGFRMGFVTQCISAALFVFLFLALQFVFLLAWACLTTVLIAFLAAVNFLYGSYYQIFSRCPNCHKQMKIPIFVCPTCSTEHTRLWPSVYGVFHHRCISCDTDLPTLDWRGRKKLVQKCVHCTHPLNKEIGRMINVHIPVIGGPSTGKSNYIVMATNQLIEEYAPPRDYTIEFPDENHHREYEANMRRLSSGHELLKTPDIVPQAYNLSIKKRGERIGRIAYIYDAAGEAYATEDNAILQTYYRYVHGIIFVIDPFSIELQRQKYQNKINDVERSLRPSTLSIMNAYERMLTVLESSVGLKRGRKFPHPIAIVISKVDALGLEEQVGDPAAQKLMQKKSSIRLEEDATSLVVEQFLIDNQLGNLVRDLYLQFDNVKFFSCSALGRMPDHRNRQAYKPLRVSDPLIWVLGQLNVVRATPERIRKMDEEHWMIAKARGGILKTAKYYYWDSLKAEGE